MRPSRVLPVLGLAAALFVAAPIASAGASTSAGANGKPEAVATLKIEKPNVEVKKKGADDFKAAKDGQELKVGDTVRTDATGLAEVDYDADTYTRLDVSTTFKIVKLTDDQGNRQVEGTVDGGQTWNRTSALTESESFKQTGAGATAAVTGTAYAVQCNADATHCDWIGIVDAFTLTGKDGVQKLVSPLDQCDSTVGVLCADITKIDPSQLGDWIIANLFKDVARGFPLPDFLQNATIVFDQDTGEAFLVPGPAAAAAPVIDATNPVLTDETGTCGSDTPGTLTPSAGIVVEDEFCAFFQINSSGTVPYTISFPVIPSGSVGLLCAPATGPIAPSHECTASPYYPTVVGYQGILDDPSAPYNTTTQFASGTVFVFAPADYEGGGTNDGSFVAAATNSPADGGATTSATVPVSVYEDDSSL